MKYCLIVTLLAVAVASCNYSSYPIDDVHAIKVDTNLFGIWKAVEDTVKENFILVQNYDDAQYSYNEILKDHGSIAKWYASRFQKSGDSSYMSKDTMPMYYSLIAEEEYRPRIENYVHYITYFANRGRNSAYTQWDCFLSKVKGSVFLNVPYRYRKTFDDKEEGGHLLVRFVKITPAYDTITTALVSDPYLKTAKNSAEVRSRVTKNLNNKNYYSDTVHFYKVKGGHFGLNESMKLAN